MPKEISIEDFTPEEIKMLVEGAQTFLAPVEDESDDEPYMALTKPEKSQS